jgi:hypothetical protein
MNRFFHLLLLAVITFNLGMAFAEFGREPTVLLDRNAISDEVPQAPPQPTPNPVPNLDVRNPYDNRFRTESITEQLPDGDEAFIEYPQFIKPAGGGEAAFNRFLEQRMRRSYATISNRRRAAIRQREGKGAVTEIPLTITYETIYADQRLVSLKFTHRVTVDGEAKPIDHPETMNYDLSRDRLIKLSELFRPGHGYLTVLGSYSRGRLEERYHNYLYVEDGTAPRKSSFECWNLSPEGLMISFDGGSLGERSIEPQVVIVPYDLLWGLYGPQSLIDRFIDHC